MVGALYRNERPGQLPNSWYVASTKMPPERPPLYGQTTADVCVVGAGFTGLSAARHLAAKGLDVVVLDAHRVGFGASGRNGGQVCTAYNMPQRQLATRYGADHARRLWDLSEEAKQDIRNLCHAEVPEARFRPGLVEAAAKQGEVAEMHRNAAFLQDSYGYDKISMLDRDAIQDLVRTRDYHGGTFDMGAGHIHPLRYVLAMARLADTAGVRIFERSEVHQIIHGDPAEVCTDKGRVRASHVILAGNGYLPNIERKVAAKILPINSFIAATEPLGERAAELLTRDIAVNDSKFVLNYYRMSEDGRLLMGGRASSSLGFPKDITTVMIARMQALFPQLAGVRMDYAWGGTLGITTNRLPAIQRVGPNILSAGGYSGQGVALSGLAGKVMAEAIAGQAGRFDTLADLKVPNFPGGTAFRTPIRQLGVTWFALRDKLGI